VKEGIFSHQQGELELFRNSDFGANFCFNSKPSFSFDSCRQRTKFPVASNYSCNLRRIGLESKLPSALKVKGNEQNFLLPQHLVVITEESV